MRGGLTRHGHTRSCKEPVLSSQLARDFTAGTQREALAYLTLLINRWRRQGKVGNPLPAFATATARRRGGVTKALVTSNHDF